MRNREIRTFYMPEMIPSQEVMTESFSKSPLKPKLLLEHIKRITKNWPEEIGFNNFFLLDMTWKPFSENDFLIAHKENYVNDFFKGIQPAASSNQMPWSKELTECVKHTNSSLYHAIKYSNEHPNEVCFSPTSGFHHAMPDSGLGFCTFSGQVIASVKLYRDKGLIGAYIDLDGHIGNSIEDSRKFVPDINKAIPDGFNVNILKKNRDYIEELKKHLTKLEAALLENKLHYVVFCHGADSHEWDDTEGQCDTQHWLMCSDIFYNWISEMDKKLNRPLPLTISLFGGYRQDRYESVLDLHSADLIKCAQKLCGLKVNFDYMNLPAFVENEELMDKNYAKCFFNFMPNKLKNPLKTWEQNKYTKGT